MVNYISVKETAVKWSITVRRVQVYCSQNRIAGQMHVGGVWITPADAVKPTDPRKEKNKLKREREKQSDA